jgi:hypothetical protein
MYNVLFPSGRVLELGTLEVAEMYCKAYNGTLLPQETLDNVVEPEYNGFVEMMNGTLEII